MQVVHLIGLVPFVYILAVKVMDVIANNKRAKRIARTNYGRYAR